MASRGDGYREGNDSKVTRWSLRPHPWGLGLLLLACGSTGASNDRALEEEREASNGVANGEGQTLGELCANDPARPDCRLLIEVGSTRGPSFIRVENASDEPYDDVELSWPEASWNFGAVPPGGRSDYAEIPQAYNYARTRIRASDGFYRLTPTDFAGEAVEAPGYFTYKLILRWQGETDYRPIDGIPVVGFVELELVVDSSLD
jgi:hypothetical protein